MNQSYCNNCGKPGHSFHHCKSPIVSYGVIAFRKSLISELGKYEYLMIRRKDTLGFIDFMRGKYSVYNKEYILNMIKQMTNSEKMRIKVEPFSKLWSDLWGETAAQSDTYKSEEMSSKNKFELLRSGVYTRYDFYNLEELVDLTPAIWAEPEWGFPKGRRNYQERDCDCAIREFCEETGYNASQLVMLKNIQPFEEIFTGSNYKSYKHKYYVMCMEYEDTLSHRNEQLCEVSGSAWLTADECTRVIRPYNAEKLRVVESVDRMLTDNYLISATKPVTNAMNAI